MPGRKLLTLVATILAEGLPHRSRQPSSCRREAEGAAVPGHGPRSWWLADDDRSGLDESARCTARPSTAPPTATPGTRLPRAGGNPGRHGRGVARPAAQGLVAVRFQALRRGAGRPGAPSRRHRRANATGRLELLVPPADRHPRASRGALLPHRPRRCPDSGLHRGIDDEAWAPIAYADGGEAQVAETPTWPAAGASGDSFASWCAAAASPAQPS